MSTEYILSTTPFTTYGKIDGGPVTSTFSGNPDYYFRQSQGIRFASNSATIEIYDYLAAQIWEVFQDGILIATVTLANSSAFGYATLASGLDTGAIHEYELRCKVATAGQTFSSKIRLDTSSLSTVAHAARLTDCFIGDSINVGFGLTDYTQTYAWKVTQALGRACSIQGGSGAVLAFILSKIGPGGTGSGYDEIGPIISRVVHEVGVNDVGVTSIGAIGSAGTYKGDWYTLLGRTRANITDQGGSSTAWILCLEIFHSGSATYNAALEAVVAQYKLDTGDNFVQVFITANWLTQTQDGTHPNDAGTTELKNRLIPIMAGYGAGGTGFTIAGASGTVTVTIASGATFMGDQKITLSASAGNITATSAGGTIGNNGTGAVDVTPVAGATSFTYVGTATAAITYTNDQLWDNPANTSYTPPLPAIPTGVALDIGGSAVQVHWNDPSDSSISHDIYRGLLADHSDTALLTNVAGGTITYNDTGTTSGVRYYYRVRAVNSAGNSAFVDVDGVSQGPLSAGGGMRMNTAMFTGLGLGLGLN